MHYLESTMTVIIAIIVVLFIYGFYKKRKEEEEEPDIQATPLQTNTPKTMSTENKESRLDTLMNTLKKLNCEATKLDDDDNRWRFSYQGEYFCVDAEEDSCNITVWDFFWHKVPLDDLDEISLVRRAINEINTYNNNACAIIYSIDDEDHTMAIHTKAVTVFDAVLGDTASFMQMILAGFFVSKREFVRRLDQLRLEEKKEE